VEPSAHVNRSYVYDVVLLAHGHYIIDFRLLDKVRCNVTVGGGLPEGPMRPARCVPPDKLAV